MSADPGARASELTESRSVAEPARRPMAPGQERIALSTGDSPEATLQRMASAAGNRRVARTLARMEAGGGILPGGLIHPDVEAAIAAAGGRGRALDRDVASQVGASFGDSFADVRVHDDAHAAALSSAVSARAFTVGRDIFFGAGEYVPGTAAGRELLTHELTHVVQQRGAPQTGPLTVSEPGDVLEREAEAAARRAV